LPTNFGFAKRYCNATHNGYGWDFSGASNLDELQNKLRSSVMIRRKKEDVLKELPAKTRQVIEIENDENAVKNEKKASINFQEQIQKLKIAVELSKAESEEAYKEAVDKLRECAKQHFEEIARLRHETALAKVPYVIDYVNDILENDDKYKLVLFAHHKDVVQKLAEEFGNKCVLLTGEMKLEDRQASVDRFQNDETCNVFIGSLKAAGVGITLTKSSHVIFVELDWTPGNMSQCEDRVHRIGQVNSVLIQHLVLQSSVDVNLARTLVEKQEIIDNALDTEKPVLQNEIVTGVEYKVATENLTVKKVEQQAQLITEERKIELLKYLKILSSYCDGAQALDGKGFNKIDTEIGHSLASQSFLSNKQAVIAEKLVRKYHRQIKGL
jgi:SWI/SNF-related matrix-associated actin-dependent regulator 1 of chromatin subfamily A